ncbi:helix-turn-helix domain protein [Clostridium sp. CAG:768]|jgi:transcriptional regulator with XRE-family HTH domain|nr:helix-turn-helix domain protein [Clostridium sp. CAG:768]
MQIEKRKKLIMKILGENIQRLRGDKSQFILSSENDISCSIISTVERGLKDPQFTTLFKIAEALNIKASELVKLVENELPKNFSMIDK